MLLEIVTWNDVCKIFNTKQHHGNPTNNRYQRICRRVADTHNNHVDPIVVETGTQNLASLLLPGLVQHLKIKITLKIFMQTRKLINFRVTFFNLILAREVLLERTTLCYIRIS